MSNRERFIREGDEEIVSRVREGGRLMSLARRMRDGRGVDEEQDYNVVEETALCVVLTNGVEVQVHEMGPIGIAVYDQSFSWINHSCSPNACYRFSTVASLDSGGPSMRIVASGSAHETTTVRITS